MNGVAPSKSHWAWHLLLIIPFIGTLWVPFYNAVDPPVGGFPYFYWYQFAWVPIGALLNAIVYFATRPSAAPRAPHANDANDAGRKR